MANGWLGLVIWIPGIPYDRDCYLGVSLEAQTINPQNTNLPFAKKYQCNHTKKNANIETTPADCCTPHNRHNLSFFLQLGLRTVHRVAGYELSTNGVRMSRPAASGQSNSTANSHPNIIRGFFPQGTMKVSCGSPVQTKNLH